MKRNLAALLLVGFLISCAQEGCRRFASEETSFCVPTENALGSLWFLGKASTNEIGFRMGKVADASRITVTLTRRDYLCKTNGGSSRAKFCQPGAAKILDRQNMHNVVRTYLNEQKSAWTYDIEGSTSGHPLAHCSSIPDRPHVGRCITDGEYKDIVYSAIFLDLRAGGVLKVLTDVDAQIRQWEVKTG
jgi:hypothetical protein